MTKEEKHLDLLATFHYVVGGITIIFSCMFFMHLFMGIAMITGTFFIPQQAGQMPFPAAMGWFVTIFALSFILGGWSIGGCIIATGVKLKKRKSKLFCMIVAGIECMFTPFGTVLGVFTLVLLQKESIAALFKPNMNEQIANSQETASI